MLPSRAARSRRYTRYTRYVAVGTGGTSILLFASFIIYFVSVFHQLPKLQIEDRTEQIISHYFDGKPLIHALKGDGRYAAYTTEGKGRFILFESPQKTGIDFLDDILNSLKPVEPNYRIETEDTLRLAGVEITQLESYEQPVILLDFIDLINMGGSGGLFNSLVLAADQQGKFTLSGLFEETPQLEFLSQDAVAYKLVDDKIKLGEVRLENDQTSILHDHVTYEELSLKENGKVRRVQASTLFTDDIYTVARMDDASDPKLFLGLSAFDGNYHADSHSWAILVASFVDGRFVLDTDYTPIVVDKSMDYDINKITKNMVYLAKQARTLPIQK